MQPFCPSGWEPRPRHFRSLSLEPVKWEVVESGSKLGKQTIFPKSVNVGNPIRTYHLGMVCTTDCGDFWGLMGLFTIGFTYSHTLPVVASWCCRVTQEIECFFPRHTSPCMWNPSFHPPISEETWQRSHHSSRLRLRCPARADIPVISNHPAVVSDSKGMHWSKFTEISQLIHVSPPYCHHIPIKKS
jgi:hypothetical protein